MTVTPPSISRLASAYGSTRQHIRGLVLLLPHVDFTDPDALFAALLNHNATDFRGRLSSPIERNRISNIINHPQP